MKSKTELTSISKLLSLVLRHDPQRIGLQLDESGWASVSDLLARVEAAGRDITHEQLKEVVSSSDKKRFAFSEDGTRIRANQGHSIPAQSADWPAFMRLQRLRAYDNNAARVYLPHPSPLAASCN